MSSVPGRSDSQRSYTKGDDEICVRRLNRNGKDVEGRPSDVGTYRSDISIMPADRRDPTQSCALKHFSKHRSSQLRFLAWVAYTRRYSNDAITHDERRTCPLLWCRTVFADQDQMLQHVWECPHLSKGLYFCFHCQKSERMGKFHKKCAGGPSKTERITNVAKKIFSKLGATSHKAGKLSPLSEGTFNVRSSWAPTDVKDPALFRESPSWDLPLQAQEMPDTSMCEMAADWTAACQELADTSIMAMVERDLQLQAASNVDIQQQDDSFMAELLNDYPATPLRPRSFAPKLTLDTSMSPLYRNQWKYPIGTLRPPQPTIQPTYNAPARDDLVSPMSAVGTYNSLASMEVSPTETVASGASFFTDSGYTSATSGGEASQCPSRVPSTKRVSDMAAIPEEHFSFGSMDEALSLPSVPNFEASLIESLLSTPSVSRSSSSASDKGKAKADSASCGDAESLVRDFSDILDEHIEHTKSRLALMQSNPIAFELLSMSKETMINTGLEVLVGVLEGRPPSSTHGLFAFTHIACASAILSDPENHDIHSKEWFDDLLQWVTGLSDHRHEHIYTEVATSIWQADQSASCPSVKKNESKQASNSLQKACYYFLDILQYAESMLPSDSSPIGTETYDFVQLINFEIDANNYVLDKLVRLPTIEAFWDDVDKVAAKLRIPGTICSARELELELICSAKASSKSKTAYLRFVDYVTKFCDELYDKCSSEITTRTSHRVQTISLVKRYLPDFVHSHTSKTSSDGITFEDERFDFLDPSTGTEHRDFGIDQAFLDDIYDASAPPSSVKDLITDTYSTFSMNDFPSLAPPQQPTLESSSFNLQQTALTPFFPTSSITTLSIPGSGTFSNLALASPIATTTPIKTPIPSSIKTTSNDRYKCHCGFSPSGEEKWKASNLRRHKRTQHPPDSGKKIWRCQFPNCKSEFTRSDNLRSHQKSRNHHALLVGGGGSIEARVRVEATQEGMAGVMRGGQVRVGEKRVNHEAGAGVSGRNVKKFKDENGQARARTS